MATILDKDLTRESTVAFENRLVQVTLTADQKISMKLKGMKTGTVEISIEDLFKQLAGIDDDKPKSISVPTGGIKKDFGDGPMMNLNDVRHRINVSGVDYAMMAKWDGIMKDLIAETKRK
jgi:hypothetical protein